VVPRASDVERARDLVRTMEHYKPGAPPILPTILPALRGVLSATTSTAYRIMLGDDGRQLEFLHMEGPGRQRMCQGFSELATRRTDAFTHYRLDRPQRSQRNLPMLSSELEPDWRNSTAAQLLHNALGKRCDQLRVLICEDDTVLAWVGVLREEPFTAAEKTLLGMLVPPLQARLRLEAAFDRSDLVAAALTASLAALSTSAFIVSKRGRVEFSNPLGQALLSRAGADIMEALRSAISGHAPDSGFEAIPLALNGTSQHFLVIQRLARGSAAARLQVVAQRWSLTPRQTQVLALLVEGHANKIIADRLGCARNTVELHVTALFEKTQTHSRSELAARFWTHH